MTVMCCWKKNNFRFTSILWMSMILVLASLWHSGAQHNCQVVFHHCAHHHRDGVSSAAIKHMFWPACLLFPQQAFKSNPESVILFWQWWILFLRRLTRRFTGLVLLFCNVETFLITVYKLQLTGVFLSLTSKRGKLMSIFGGENAGTTQTVSHCEG